MKETHPHPSSDVWERPIRPYVAEWFQCFILPYYYVIRVRASSSSSGLRALGWGWGWSALRARSFVRFIWALRTARSLFSMSFITTHLQTMNQEVWNLNLHNILPQKCSRAARLQCQPHVTLNHVSTLTSHFISGILSSLRYRRFQKSLAILLMPRSRRANTLFRSFPNKIFMCKY